MRMTDRILATCSVVALAALCTIAIGIADAQAARPQSQDARPAAGRSATPPRAGAPLRVSLPQPGRPVVSHPSASRASATPALRAAQSGKLRVAGTAIQQSWGGISCVPFARAATDLDVKGNAHAWWDSAAGSYERGQRPEAGSVLNFRSTNRMRLGHVAVVARVVNNRTLEIDHANWPGPGGGKGRVSRGVPVIDVSEHNDWSAVQVGLAGGGFGSVYPTYGFIYDRPDRGIMVANTTARPSATQAAPRYSEVAEAWSTRVIPATQPTRGFVDAPMRSLR